MKRFLLVLLFLVAMSFLVGGDIDIPVCWPCDGEETPK